MLQSSDMVFYMLKYDNHTHHTTQHIPGLALTTQRTRHKMCSNVCVCVLVYVCGIEEKLTQQLDVLVAWLLFLLRNKIIEKSIFML